MTEAILQNFVLGYSILGKSQLTPEGKDVRKLLFVNYDNEVLQAEYSNLFDLHAGFVLGVSVLGYSYLGPHEVT